MKRYLTSILLLLATTGFAQNKGIGISMKMDSITKITQVVKVFEGNAASEAGVKEGDWLLAINNQKLPGKTPKEIAALIANTPAPYNLQVRRSVETSLDLKIDTVTLQVSPRIINPRQCISGDCINGSGKLLITTNNFVLEGTFTNGLLTSGYINYPSGRVYALGTFKNEQLDGPNGKSYWDRDKDPFRAVGTFKDGTLREGKFWSQDGTVFYNGTFDEEGRRHGKKILTAGASGVTYEADYVHGELSGDVNDFPWQGGQYTGPLSADVPHGKGSWFYQGEIYKGTWENGKKQGNFNVVQKTKGGRYQHVYRYTDDVKH